MRSPSSDLDGHGGMDSLVAKVGELRVELNNQLTLMRSELKDIHTRLPSREPAQGNINTDTVAPQTMSHGSNGWLADLDAAMTPRPSYEDETIPGHQIIATHEDLAKLREHVKNGLLQAVATAKAVAIESVEAHVHKLLTGMDHISAQRENIVIDNSQRESTTMLHAALDRLAISHGQLLEAVAPSTTMLQAAVDRLATSHGQLLEAVAEQAERVKFIELQIFPSHADSSVCNTPRDSAKVRFKLNI
mmetsp:Transcript_86404/g.171555  ORF Transcript_86404/g.171555 Transcript_86404/m.171555 type:complete len:247 (-) Transcript_86404:89-829(-)